MEMHDIRYLHDDSLPEDDELGGDLVLPSFLTKKNILSLGIIVILVASIGIVTLNITSRTTTQSSAQIGARPNVSPEPTVTQISIEGKITCLPSETLPESECEVAIETNEGKTYSLQNVRYDDVASGTLSPGSIVTLKGTFGSSGSISDKSSFYVVTAVSNSSSPSPTPSASSSSAPTSIPTKTPTMTPIPTPTPTPIPHYVDSTPLPGVSYLTIQYIRDHGVELNGRQVNVGVYLVGGYIGSDACATLGVCGQSQFYLSDTNNPNRNIADDMLMIGSAAEKEEDYTTGQNYYQRVIVIFADSGIYLEKVY